MADQHGEPLLEPPGSSPTTWFEKYIHSWRWHATHSKWHLPNEIPKGRQSFFAKTMPLPGLIITTILSTVLLYGVTQPAFIDNDFYNFVQNHRSSVQAALSLLTSIFGFAHIYVLTSVINFSTRILLTQFAPTLERLKWWQALSTANVDPSLPVAFLIPVAAVWGLTLLPAFLWTGALTPNLVAHNITANITLPYYSPDPDGAYWNATWTPIAPHEVFRTPWGTFSYTPAYDRGDSMLTTAAGVIRDKDQTGKRPRSDQTGYTYSTRSYGVGSSLGLFTNFSQGYQNPMTYQYQEVGYNASVICGFDVNSQWVIETPSDVEPTPSPYIPNLYFARGATPDSALYWQLQYSAVDDSNVVAINAHPNLGSSGKGVVVIAAGGGPGGPYASLNQSLCNVTFIPTLFDVSVNLSSSQITVAKAGHAHDMDPTAQSNATYTAWNCETLPDSLSAIASNNISGCGNYTARGQPGLGNIATRALRQLNDLSTIDTSLHTSNLGEMFRSLVENEILYYDNTTLNITNFNLNSPYSSADAVIMDYSIEQGLKSLIDDSLLAFASAQLVLNHNASTNNTFGLLTVGAVRVGTQGYVYSLFVFNFVLILIFVEEIFRTRFWATLPLFDYNDLKGVIIASSMGGTDLANKIIGLHKQRDAVWMADPRDRIVSDVRVELKCRDQGKVELVAAQELEYTLVEEGVDSKFERADTRYDAGSYMR
ncbi:hypothetical protein MMC28_004883 [Mycoblastus sanguinarius]|nr:hypothetical protein [Mycoblastus sanguinarius]